MKCCLPFFFMLCILTTTFCSTQAHAKPSGPEWVPKREDLPALIKAGQQKDMEARFRVGLYYLFEKSLCPKPNLTIASSDETEDFSNAHPYESRTTCYPEEAIAWLLPAAQCGHLVAQHYLGYAYDELGQRDLAVSWYAIAATRGYPAAQASFGMAFYAGSGVPQDYIQAFKWINLALQRGYGRNNQYRNREVLRQKLTEQEALQARIEIENWKVLNDTPIPSDGIYWPGCEIPR